jgi:hypothetical protein
VVGTNVCVSMATIVHVQLWDMYDMPGPKFSPFYLNSSVNKDFPHTARGDVVLVGPTGGYGWIVTFKDIAPRNP